MNKNFLNKNRSKVVLLLFFSFLFISTISAATNTYDVEDTFKVNSIIDYSKPCRNNGTTCSVSANCNYTLKNPDNVEKLSVTATSNPNGEQNASFNFDEIGIWTIEMTCCDGGLCGSETLRADITGSGFNDTLGFYILILTISVLIIGAGFYMSDPPITILGTFGLYFLGIYTLINGIGFFRDSVTTWSFSLIILAVAMYISVRSAWELIA